MTGAPAVTRFAGRAGDRNPRAAAASGPLAAELGRRLGTEPVTVGTPQPPLGADWRTELDAALPDLRALAGRYAAVLGAGDRPVTALSRCAAALATLPVVAAHHPGAAVVWFDGHGDLHTPATTTSGYLGGLALSGPLGLWESPLGAGLAPADVVLAGARELDPAERALVADGTVRLVAPGAGFADRLAAAVGDRPVSVHVDCDVLAPGEVPMEYAVPGGLSLAGLHEAAEALARGPVLGLQVGELEATGDDATDAAAVRALVDALQPLLDAVRRG